jgi:hypothetical protein
LVGGGDWPLDAPDPFVGDLLVGRTNTN